MTMAFNPKPGIAIHLSDTSVYSAAAPTSFTDLDLSATIGAKQTICALQVNHDGNDKVCAFRRNGDTENYDSYGTEGGQGIQTCRKHTGKKNVILVMTDSSGIIEWISDSAGTTVEIVLLWYLN